MREMLEFAEEKRGERCLLEAASRVERSGRLVWALAGTSGGGLMEPERMEPEKKDQEPESFASLSRHVLEDTITELESLVKRVQGEIVGLGAGAQAAQEVPGRDLLG